MDFISGLLLLCSNPVNFLIIFLGVILGSVVGALPGLTAPMALAIMAPFTFTMNPVTGISFLLGLLAGSVYGGSISSILVRIPGTPAAAATVLDGYPLNQKGQGEKALGMAAVASAIGGCISVIFLMTIAPLLAKIALSFGPPEYFALGMMGITTVVVSSSPEHLLKGMCAAFFGIFLCTIGLDPVGGSQRFTFGLIPLTRGIGIIPFLIGLFGLSQVLISTFEIIENQEYYKRKIIFVKGERLKWEEIKDNLFVILRGSLIGNFIGAIPGSGAATAAFLAYNIEKKISSKRLGTGVLEGVAAPESANNAITGSSMLPMVTLGIPGDISAAIIMGAFLVLGIYPGPLIFERHGDFLWAIFIGFLIANIFMGFCGYFLAHYFTRVLLIPRNKLVAIILTLCIVGTYSADNNMFSILVMIVGGFLGYILRKGEFPLVPVVLGFILGPIIETGFRTSLLMSRGNWSIFIQRPISTSILLFTFLMLISPFINMSKITNYFKKK